MFLNQFHVPMPSAADSSLYRHIELWERWWRGKDSAFHEFYESSPASRAVKRELYRLNMAKKVCEDWAALLLNDKTAVVLSFPEEAADGGDAAGFVSRALSPEFYSEANRLVEKAFALGTGAAILRFSASLEDDGTVAGGGIGVPSFEFISAPHIIPISVKGGKITEAAFVSEEQIRGEKFFYLEKHTLAEDGYVIENELYAVRDGELVRAEGSCPSVVRTHSFVPLFSILTPNIMNNIDEASGMGVSVFADAIDCLKGVDLAFNNFCRDIKLGGKKVFMNQSLVQRDADGNIFTPDDVLQQLFVTVGDTDISDVPMIAEHNPELRSEENALAVQSQLDYLSFRCGLGSHHYSFSDVAGRTKLTATQYMGERQDMRQNAVKHQKNVSSFITGAVRALLWCAEAVYGIAGAQDALISVSFDDSYFGDSESERARELDEVREGIRTVSEYRAKWVGSVGSVGSSAVSESGGEDRSRATQIGKNARGGEENG